MEKWSVRRHRQVDVLIVLMPEELVIGVEGIPTMVDPEALQAQFTKAFSLPPEIAVRAPGRVNLIGEHTDYNGGFVLPMAIDREIVIAARRRNDSMVRMVALDMHGERSQFSIGAIERDDVHSWSNYVRGVALALQSRGMSLTGIDMAIQGDVPIGSGLSSSAALEVCSATMLQLIGDLAIDKVEIARLCQEAENEFVGVKSGIMDQFVSVLARADQALLIDCRDLSYDYVPIPPGISVVICDTMKRRGLVDSEYNARRSECEQAVQLLSQKVGRTIRLLRDVSPEEFARSERELPPKLAARARHVVSENQRVLDAVAAMKKRDLTSFGRIMDQSHRSLRDDYEVSCGELDVMVEVARKQPGCVGARLTGAGFGGCTVNIVADASAEAFVKNVAREYRAQVGIKPQIYACRAAAGAGLIS